LLAPRCVARSMEQGIQLLRCDPRLGAGGGGGGSGPTPPARAAVPETTPPPVAPAPPAPPARQPLSYAKAAEDKNKTGLEPSTSAQTTSRPQSDQSRPDDALLNEEFPLLGQMPSTSQDGPWSGPVGPGGKTKNSRSKGGFKRGTQWSSKMNEWSEDARKEIHNALSSVDRNSELGHALFDSNDDAVVHIVDAVWHVGGDSHGQNHINVEIRRGGEAAGGQIHVMGDGSHTFGRYDLVQKGRGGKFPPKRFH